MNFNTLLSLVSSEPVFTTGLLLSGNVSAAVIRLQLSRWVKTGKIIQLRRGLYTLAQPYIKRPPHPFYLSNHLKAASYVSLQSALSYYGLIPEKVPTTTAVTTSRPGAYATPLGRFTFRHVKKTMFNHYTGVTVYDDQPACMAVPEKALIDLLYLTPGSDTAGFISELRLQNTDVLDIKKLERMASESGSAKLNRAVTYVHTVVKNQEYETL